MLKIIALTIALSSTIPAYATALDHYSPQSIVAKGGWNKITQPTKQEIYDIEHVKYYDPNNEETGAEIGALISYDMQITQNPNPAAVQGIDRNSYTHGFMDSFTLMSKGLQILENPKPSKTRSIVRSAGKFIHDSSQTILQNGMSNRPTYIQQTGPGYAPGAPNSYMVY